MLLLHILFWHTAQSAEIKKNISVFTSEGRSSFLFSRKVFSFLSRLAPSPLPLSPSSPPRLPSSLLGRHGLCHTCHVCYLQLPVWWAGWHRLTLFPSRSIGFGRGRAYTAVGSGGARRHLGHNLAPTRPRLHAEHRVMSTFPTKTR